MHILQIIPSLNSGGAERTTIDIAKYLCCLDITNSIITQEGKLISHIPNKTNLTLLPVASKNPLIILINALRIASHAKAHKVTLFHVRSRAPALSVFLASKISNIPYIATFHGIYSSQNSLKKFFNSFMLRGTHTIANSYFTANHINQTYNYPLKNISVIHRGVDLTLFSHLNLAKKSPKTHDPQPHDKARKIIKQLKFSPNHLNILLPGRFTSWKGHAIAIEACATLKTKHIKFKLAMVGDFHNSDRYISYLKELINTHNLQENIIILPHTDLIHICMDNADIVLSCSTRPEAFGRIAAEACATGAITVASQLGGACETIIDKETGFHVQANDSQALSKILQFIHKLPNSDKNNIKIKAVKFIKDNFSLEQMCTKTWQIYCQYQGKI